MTIKEREYYQYQINDLRPYILTAFRWKGITKCERCGKEGAYEINHKRYAPDITINDLELVCVGCHASITGASHDASLSGVCHACHRPL